MSIGIKRTMENIPSHKQDVPYRLRKQIKVRYGIGMNGLDALQFGLQGDGG